jgi:hypothetical protein
MKKRLTKEVATTDFNDTEASFITASIFLASCILLLTSLSFAKTYNVTQITSQSQSSVSFVFTAIRTNPGDEVHFDLPKNLQNQKLSFVILGHRQDPNTHKGGTPGQKQDMVPGLSAVLVHSTNLMEPTLPDSWRWWAGMASGNLGAKFAEPRADLEMENLYEWNTKGTAGMVGAMAADTKNMAVGTDMGKPGGSFCLGCLVCLHQYLLKIIWKACSKT